MDDNNAVRYRLRPKQKLFVDSTAMFCLYIGGIGAGKSFAGAVRSIKFAIEHPGSFGLIGAPTFPMLRNTTMRTFFDLCPPGLIKSFNKNENLLTMINGSEILFASMDDPDKVRGLNLSWFWLDEAPLCGYYAWKVLKGRAGRQNPKKYPRAGWATGTPKGKDGFWQDFENHPLEGHQLIRASTYENAVNLPDNYADSLGYEGAFKQQEIEGRFEAYEGLVYEINVNPGIGSHILLPRRLTFKLPSGAYLYETEDGFERFKPDDLPEDEEDERELITLKSVYGGVDWGYTNPAVCLIIGVDDNERCYVLEEFYERRASLQNTVFPRIVDMCDRFEVEVLYCDPAEPQNILDLRTLLSEKEMLTLVKAGDNNILSGINAVRNSLALREQDRRPGLLIHKSCVKTIDEFGAYQYSTKEVKDRNPKEKPLPQNDHALDALRYVIFSVFGLNRNAPISVAATHNIEHGSTESSTVRQQHEEILKLQSLLESQMLQEAERKRAKQLVDSMRFLERMGILGYGQDTRDPRLD